MIVTDKVEVYRLKLRRGISSSYPDWKLYESKEEFERDLLESLIEEASSYENRSPFQRACSFWVAAFSKNDDSYNYRPVSRVIGAERLVNGEWVSVNPRLVPPRLEFD